MPNNNDYFKMGDWNVLCDICGFKYKASQLKKNWKNEWVCPQDFELRNQQDFIRVRPEKIAAPWVRPDNDGIDVGPTCYFWSQSASSDLGTADCMKADNTPMSFLALLQLKFGSPTGPTGAPYPYPTQPFDYVCTLIGRLSYSGYAVAGCMLPSNITGF